MKTLIKNIGLLGGVGHESKLCLRGKEMSQFNIIRNAYLYIEDGKVKSYGLLTDIPKVDNDTLIIDAEGGSVMPSFCDSHTHVVFAGSREGEFVDKIRGLSYAEIAKRGGGILNSSDKLHELSEDELYEKAMKRVDEVIRKGTGAMEIKSGYGLDLENELKMLRVIKRIKETAPVKVVSNFLGAHAVGREFAGRQSEYVAHIINDMLPAVAKENLADFMDVFCDEGFFTAEETRQLLKAGLKYGIRGKIHGEELAVSGGVEAVSYTHLTLPTN